MNLFSWKRNLQIILIVFLQIDFIDAQNIFFENISHKEDLYQNTVLDITQDKNGFLWLGTPKGLIKYDGLNFTVYEQYQSNGYIEPIKKVHAIHMDDNGNIWAGSSSGIYKYDQEKEKIFKIENTQIFFDKESQFISASNKKIFIQATSGIYLLNDSNSLINEPLKINGLNFSSVNIKSLHQIKDSLYIFGMEDGLGTCIYNPALKQFKALHYYTELQRNICLCKETESILWLGFNNGIKRFKLSEKGELEELDFSNYTGFSSLKNTFIKDIYKASDGYIYVATWGNGLIRINTIEKNIEVFRYDEHQPSIGWDVVHCIFEDHTGILWFGTLQGGLTKYDTNKKPFYNLQHIRSQKKSLSHNHINRVLVDSKKYLWVSTYCGGLNISEQPITNTDFNDIKFKTLPAFGDSYHTLFQLEHYVLISGSSKLYFYDLNTHQTTEVPPESILGKILQSNPIVCFEKDHKNRLWLGCINNIFCIDYDHKIEYLMQGNITLVELHKKKYDPNIDTKINQIYCTSQNKVLIASENGFYMAHEKNDYIDLIHYVHEKNEITSLSQNEVTSIYEDPQKQIWLGTFNGGLNQVIFNDEYQIIEFKNFQNGIRLSENCIKCIEGDFSGNLWLSSYNGLYKYNISSNEYTNYSTSDGLSTNLFHKYSSLKTEDGMLIFGSINGLTAFYPEQIKTNTFPPKVSITRLKIFNKTVQINEKLFGKVILPSSVSSLNKIVLPYKCNVISLEFAAVQLSSPLKNTFYYKLEEFDRDWNETSAERNFCTYTNLPPGDYKFKLTATNSDGIRNNDILELGITILPPWYLTPLAISLFFLCSLGIFFTTSYYIRKLTSLKHELQIEKIEKAKEKEIYEAKQRFFTNVSHEVKTPLSLILGPLGKVLKSDEINPSDKKSLLIIDRNAHRLHRLINQMMDFRKLEQNKLKLYLTNNDLNNLIQQILVNFEEEFKQNNLQIIFKPSQRALIFNFDQDKIEKVIYNILSNAIKHTPENGIIKIRTFFNKTKDQVYMEIYNQGQGIPNDQKQHIFERFYQVNNTLSGTGVGLAMVKNFIELHQGLVTEEGVYGENALFKIMLPTKVDLTKSNTNMNESLHNDVKEAIDSAIISKESTNQLTGHHKSHTQEKRIVLLVEDHYEMLEYISDSLAEKYNILRAKDGVQGLKIAEKEIPEIIITDVMMPNMEGKEFCRLLKEKSITSHIPVIMLTAKDTVEQQIEGLNAGADAYLTKPFQMDHLLAQMENLLESRKKMQESFKQKYGLGIKKLSVTTVDEQLINKFVLFIEENISDPELRVSDVAQEMSYSYMQFNRKIKAITGESVGQFVNNYRLNRAKQVFNADPGRSISEVMYSVGFKSTSYFSKCFKEQFKMTPKEYKMRTKQ